MQDDKKKIIMLPELYVFFIIMTIVFFVNFVAILTYNLLHHDNNEVLVVILSIFSFAATVAFPIIGIKAGVFNYIVLDNNCLIILCTGKTKQIIEKANVMAVEKEIGYMSSTFIRIDFIQSNNQDKKSLMLSYSKRRMETVKSWFNKVV